MAEDKQPAALLNYKPVLQKYVEAHIALQECMAAVPHSDLTDMSAAQLDSMCGREKIAIKSILDSNKMTMTQVVKDRLNVMYAIKEVGINVRETYKEI